MDYNPEIKQEQDVDEFFQQLMDNDPGYLQFLQNEALRKQNQQSSENNNVPQHGTRGQEYQQFLQNGALALQNQQAFENNNNSVPQHIPPDRWCYANSVQTQMIHVAGGVTQVSGGNVNGSGQVFHNGAFQHQARNYHINMKDSEDAADQGQGQGL